METSSDVAKKAAGEAAIRFVQENMVIGLGTGSTVYYFIKKLATLCQEGFKIQTVSTSLQTEKLAKNFNIPLVDINTFDSLNLSVDGADEIDLHKNMIKGGGGALLREKIVAKMSRHRVTVVDQRKDVQRLGGFPLPVEIAPFGWKSTINQMEEIGLHGKLRINSGTFFITDNGNYIFDIEKENLDRDLNILNAFLLQIPGVIQTGLFFGLSDTVLIGSPDGHVEER